MIGKISMIFQMIGAICLLLLSLYLLWDGKLLFGGILLFVTLVMNAGLLVPAAWKGDQFNDAGDVSNKE